MSESEANFIACLKWVKRGVSKRVPDKVQLSKKELIEVINDTRNKLKIAKQNEGGDQGAGTSALDPADEFDMEKYDEDDEGTANALGISSLAELPNEVEENFSESDDSDAEDDVIKPNDNLLLVGRVAGEACVLEVQVYNEYEPSFYVHHEIYLTSFPLCFEWMNYEPGVPAGSYCAVGQMGNSIIEVWDLDIVNCIEPAFQLGKKASTKKNRPRVGHKKAVTALAWNKHFDHVLASGSADDTVLLWDMEKQTATSGIEDFTDVVQCLQWHPMESQIILGGSCDKTARVYDCRQTQPQGQSYTINGEVEKATWNPLQPYLFFAGSSTGIIQCIDTRKGVIWSVEAHSDQEITGLSVSNQCPGLLVSSSGGSEDVEGTVKVWDYTETEAVCVYEKDFGPLGNIRCMELSPDSPFVIAVGGDKKSDNVQPYDLRHIDAVNEKFGSRELVQLTPESTSESMES